MKIWWVFGTESLSGEGQSFVTTVRPPASHGADNGADVVFSLGLHGYVWTCTCMWLRVRATGATHGQMLCDLESGLTPLTWRGAVLLGRLQSFGV